MWRLIAVFIFFTLTLSFGQVPVGSWRDHLSYSRASNVAVTPDKVFCAAGSGIIVYNKRDGSIEKLSKVNGLSDIDISSLKWSEEKRMLIVGYANGNLDFISDNKVTNLADILRSSVAGSKRINNILLIGHRAYLSCSFGIVVVDLDRNEIRDSFFLGEGGVRLGINDMAFDGTYLYAASSSGLYRADMNTANLLDFSNWTSLDFLPEPGALFSSLAWFSGSLYAVQMAGNGTYVPYKITGDSWEYFSAVSGVPVLFSTSLNYMSFIHESEAEIYGQGQTLVQTINNYGFWGKAIRDIIMEEDGNIWIADRLHGLVNNSGDKYTILTPSGPYSNRVFSISSYAGRTHFSAGGYNQAFGNLWHNGEYNIYKDNSWRSVLNYDIRDVVLVKEHPSDPEIHFLATWGYGLIEYRSGTFHERYGENNSSLRSIIPGGDAVRINGLAFDDDKNLWVTNTGVPNPVSVRKANGEWQSFPYGSIINHDYVGDIIINSLGHKWVLLPRGGGLFVFENNGIEENSMGRTRKFSITDNTNTLISNEVYSIAEDNNGFIWVGTQNGVAVYFNPSDVFSDEPFYARRIVVSGDRQDDLGYLLNNETVTSIAVDGADRKWFGTEKSGVFLVSSDGTRQIHHFTRQNSPLLSNTISDIAIEPETGEVFFGTSVGVVSFRGDATASRSGFENVYVFPNPVRENYDGPVTVTGLIKDSIIKITDISGNLVYETVSLGGQAIWDGRNSRGNRVHTGIYLIFISSADGSETHIAKLMFIH
jgi:hypothetical protein